MYYDDPIPWYKDARVMLIIMAVLLIIYGWITGQICVGLDDKLEAECKARNSAQLVGR